MISSPRAISLCLVASLVLCPRMLFAAPSEYQPDYDRGYERGYKIGHKSGFGSGKLRGIEEGTVAGKDEGYDIGWNDAYQPAYDRAYDHFYPIGRGDGWNQGVVDGFDEGIAWATRYLETINAGSLVSYGVIVSSGFGGGWYIPWNPGDPPGTNTGAYGSFAIDTFGGWDPNYDWAAHYFREGQSAGRTDGLEIGDTEGYDFVYPRAYKKGYRIGYGSGAQEGRFEGTTNGTDEGFDAGWDYGFDVGHDQGFDAGADYLFYGTFNLAAPAWAQATFGQGAAGVPEPVSLALVVTAAALVCCWRPSRTISK